MDERKGRECEGKNGESGSRGAESVNRGEQEEASCEFGWDCRIFEITKVTFGFLCCTIFI